MRAGPGEYHGFFCFYFIMNKCCDSECAVSTRLQHGAAPLLLALPPGVAISLERYLPTLWRLDYKPADRQGRARLLALVLDWPGDAVLPLCLQPRSLFDAIYPPWRSCWACGVAASEDSVAVGVR